MSMILSLTTTRRLLVDLAAIRKAGKLDELKARLEDARASRMTAVCGVDPRPDALLLESIMGAEYSAVISLAAAELTTWQAVSQSVVQKLAQECREASRNAV